ncbi:putative E3 ubiquitin-protein ligase ARI10 [Pseudocercospora fuligena]|uniref:RBR-type E3 ubiquitin transferase n=1 Tax=Pseudocercospora fuligena TaxID=685502 RepID=A0A8H6RD44_9PEZI|nr:putative E3 ubiquitin-protein ligase ARI10 [Pseudocercospora fuligena]
MADDHRETSDQEEDDLEAENEDDETEAKDGRVELQWQECDSCSEDDGCYRAPCGHDYCINCLVTIIVNSMDGEFSDDKRQYPPRCCEAHIPFGAIRHLLPTGLVQTFEAKEPELKDHNPVYCHACKQYIDDSQRKNSLASCPSCPSMRTCIECKKAAHAGECSEDPDEKKLRERAREEGWKICPRCRTVIEKAEGCNHITCACGAEFCYLCGEEYDDGGRTCWCVWEDD